MSIIDKKLIKQAADAYGFNLEFRTQKCFEENKYKTICNIKYPSYNKDDKKYIELDLVATPFLKNFTFLVECKGAARNSILILIKSSSSSKEIFYRKEVNKDYRIMGYKGDNLFHTFSGDFFKKISNDFKKISNNDSNNLIN